MSKEAANSAIRALAGKNGGRKSIEDALANVWAGVLRVAHVDRSANFFEIGGDSLKAMEVIARVREVLQADLPLMSFFEDPTIRHHAEVIAGGRNDLEAALAKIWAEVLQVEQVDRDAYFFEIGGDSLKAMEIIARVSEVLHVDLPLIAFFEEPTVRHLADVLSADTEDTAGRLAKIWEEVLRLPGVTRDANFFDIGGDSLKAMEVIVKVSESMKVDLPLIAFFEEPTVAHLAAVIDGLKEEGTTPPIVRVADRREFPLTYSQQVFWLLEQQNPGIGLYNKPRVFRIRGRVDAGVLERSLNELRQRHEILRVRFVSGVNGPVQIVEQEGSMEFSQTDLSSLEVAKREPAAMKLALETVRQTLDLTGGQVQRAHLMRLAEDEFVLCIAEHHVANDGFTGSILLDELGAVYDAFAAGEPSPLAPPEVHYTDFAVWEQSWMQGERLQSEMEYWRTLLEGAPRLLDVPTDFVSAMEPDRRGHLRSRLISGDLPRGVQALAQSKGTTQFTVMAAALRLLLARWSGQAEFLLGTTASNRSRSGTERMPGPFVNPLPLRNAVYLHEPATDLLEREKRVVMEAFAHQDCPFQKIVEAVNPERSSSDNPLFNVGLVMENFPEVELKARHFEAEYLNFDPEVSLIDLRFIAVEKHGGLRLSCEYKSAMFLPETIDALLEAYEAVLTALVSNPGRLVGEFELPRALVKQAESSVIVREQAVAIAATYTAEPIQETLEFWLKQLGMPTQIVFAPFNQVFQQLLDSTSLLARNRHGASVVLLRVEDIVEAQAGSPEAAIEEFLSALRAAAKREAAPLVVVVTPPSDASLANDERHREIEAAEAQLVSGARKIAGVQVVSSSELLQLYPVADYEDDYSYAISHIPYKPAMFTAMATMVARCIFASRHSAAEVIVIDGDSALWGKSSHAVREFLLAQEKEGLILALCSNDPEDAVAARLAAGGAGLNWQNIALSRCGVRAKSHAINEILEELALGQGHCIFVTADPLDATEVRSQCPGVVVVELPADDSAARSFLENFWAFDRAASGSLSQIPLPGQSEFLNRVATELATVDSIAAAVEASRSMRARAQATYSAPRSPEEEFLAETWSRLLRVEQPGIHENFFSLGGHSLMAAQVIARVRQTLGVELPLRAMFEAPTIAQFAERIEAELRARRKLESAPMVRVSREGPLPLSFSQQRVWFVDQMDPGTAVYNVPATYRLRGPLNVKALERAIQEVIQRHESLRTTFHNIDGQAVQVIAAAVWPSLEVIEVRGAGPAEREAELGRLTRAEAAAPFDLARDLLIRPRLFSLGPNDHMLMVVVHHIVFDGWSGSLLAGELASFYGAFAQDQPSPLPELKFQYVDYAVRQRQHLQGEALARQVSYWRRQLDGAPAVLELPMARPRPTVASHRGALYTHVIAKDVIEELRDCAQSEGATLFMALLAGFQLMLSRYSGSEDIVVGSTIAGRNDPEVEPLIGFFVNTLSLRTDLAGDPTCRELLARVKQVALEAYAHQDIPFEKLVEELQPERSTSYNPIYQVLFGLQNVPRQKFEASGLDIERSAAHPATSILDMSWFAFETDEGLLLRLEYSTDLFDAEAVAGAVAHYQNILRGMVAAPEARISQVPMLADAERHQILVEFNDTAHEFPRNLCLHQMFEQQVQRTPDAVAVDFHDAQITYRSLNEMANQVAHFLHKRSIRPGSKVGLYIERSLEMMVGLLGIQKSGAAYVPLDPHYPPERVRLTLQDAQVPLILTQQSLVSALPEQSADVYSLDTDWPLISQESTANLQSGVRPEDLVYVIFTSGSTGRPKGVQVPHRAVVNLMNFMGRELQVGTGDVFPALASFAFDMCIPELYLALTTGATVLLCRRELASNGEELAALLRRKNATIVHATPTTWSLLLEEDFSGKGLKRAIGAEPLPHELFVRLMEADDSLYNFYGPTETTVWSTYQRFRSPDEQIVVGRPLDNTQVYILDRYLQPVPVGALGEIYIGGDGVTCGYLNRPEQTAEKFVADPFASRTDARMYRTGDLGTYLADGRIDFRGRVDNQVKLRGFRIELGEVEMAIGSHPAVNDCVAVAREDVPGDKRLVAYFIPIRPGAVTPSELRQLVADRLPDYMVPSAIVEMERFPLSPNGKMDRRTLPAPLYSREDEGVYVAPRSASERELSDIWSEVLHLDRTGIHDNFFRLGGHSLLATQVISRIRKRCGVELPLRSIFEAPTVAELALRIDQLSAQDDALPAVRRVPREGDLPLSFAQQRLWFLNQLDPNSPYYNTPMALRLSGELASDALRAALNEIIRRHETLRTTYVMRGDKPVQIIRPEVRLDLPVTDLSHVAADDQEAVVRQIALESGRQVFNLQTGPLVRGCLLKLSDHEHVLLLNFHHISNDGWSVWQLVNELAPLYEAFRENKPSPLPELAVQYADFAVWQHGWMQGAVMSRQLEYWKKQLAGAPDTLDLPTDRRRPAELSLLGTTEKAVFPRELVDRLNRLGQQQGTTLFMTLLAAFQTLLHRYTRQDDIVVGSPIANRNRAEIENLIGFFVNTLVMRTDLSGNPTFLELLDRVRTTALGAYSNQDLPFEKLVEVLRPERELGRIPLFQVWFVLQNAPRASLQLPGLELRTMDVHNGTAKFDLGLFTVEKPDGLYCSVEYSTDLFEAPTIQRFLGHYRELLEAIAADPTKRLGELSLLTGPEREQVVVQWNDTVHGYPRERSLHEFIEEQVERTPEATALVFESERLTYRELNSRANQLAHRLREMGVVPERIVAVCAHRSVEMVVALLATLKAGGAYVPIDPDYPKSRLAVMLEDAEAPVLLTQEHLLDLLPQHDLPTICLDRDWHTLASLPSSNLPVVTTGKDQAYMIYTSGSTGKPKGVPNVHEGIVNRLLWMQNAYGLDGADRVVQKTPFSFDVSVWEFFWPLMTGATLVVARPDGHKDPDYLIDLIQQHGITTIHFVPSMLRIFLEAEGVERCTSLRRVICSGEALPYELQQRFFEVLNAELHNLYGPTEAAVDVSFWQCLPNPSSTVVPIGKPVWNTQLYVLDSYLQPVPIGVPGELHIGGVQLARGYLKRPELTAEKFIPDPFSSNPGARLYKTGDLARFLPDGNIEYLGRIDHQIKLRGFRIELGEIETALDSHPGVMQSVVMAREDAPGDKRLVAYVVPDPNYREEDSGSSDSLGAEQVSQWSEAFDEAYRRGGGVEDGTFNIKGWDSSYTGQPIPSEEMRVWVESTVDRIKALRPKAVWEIGCGTGLLLFRVAPGTERYFGTDISHSALSFLEQQLQRPELKLPQVALELRAAHEFDADAMRRQFDAVVLNSVIQYFPDIAYLMDVLDRAIASVRPGGAVFLGDVRSLPLLPAFHTSVETFKADNAMSRVELARRVQKGIRQEGELLVDPEFFGAARQRWPQITGVEIQLKRGRAHNELTRFRYDVVLHIGKNPPERIDCAWVDWGNQGLTLSSLAEILQTSQPETLGVSGVPNARLCTETAALNWLTAEDAASTVGGFRKQLDSSALPTAVEPEDLWRLGEDLGYQVEVRPSQAEVDGCCNVLLRRRRPGGNVAGDIDVIFPGEAKIVRPWTTYASNPLRQRVAAKLAPQLRLYVGSKLPEYMVPSAFVLLDTIPLTSSGKVDRRALPPPDQSRSEGIGDYRAPQTPTEEIIAAIFVDVLRVERVGVDDNFFEMGGHSLSATQLVSRIRQNLAVDLPVRAVFECPTVATLSQTADQKQRTQQGSLAPPIERAPRSQRLPLSFAQQRLWVLDQIEPDNPMYNIPRAMRLSGRLDPWALETALNGVIQRHEILRTTYRAERGEPYQVIAPDSRLQLRVVDLRDLASSEREDEARRIVEQESYKPFHLDHDLMVRATLLRLDEEEHILMMVMHHIASDGWSSDIMLRELSALYDAVLRGETANLDSLPVQYADYAVWQRHWLQGEVLGRQLAYWRQQLEGAPPLLLLPTDRPRATKETYRGLQHRTFLSPALTDALRALGRQHGSTVFMTKLAAFQCLVFHLTQQPDFVLGTDLANRTVVHTEALIGFFVNLLALRADLSGDPRFTELLSRVREVALGAYAHQDLPFDKLVEELQPERSLSHAPLVQVLFVQQNTPRAANPLRDVEMRPYPLEVPSKFDMGVFFTETDSGISAAWLFDPDLFDASSIVQMQELYRVVLEAVTARPEIRLTELCQRLAEEQQKYRVSRSEEFQKLGLQKLKNVKRKTISQE